MKHLLSSPPHDDPAATLDDLREAVTTLEDVERIARRVLGDAHPLAAEIGTSLRQARAILHFREFRREMQGAFATHSC